MAEVTLNDKEGYEKPINKLSEPGFFNLCYPCIFKDGSWDITACYKRTFSLLANY